LSRSLGSFLSFLALLAVISAVGIWWMGSSVVTIAVDEERRTQPYYLLHLLKQSGGGAAAGAYFRKFSELAREEEGQLLWRGALAQLYTGRLADEYQDVSLFEFVRGGDLVQMLTSASYRTLTESSDPVLLGSGVAPHIQAGDQTLLVWLLEASTEEPDRSLALEGLSTTLSTHEGQIIWMTPVDVVAGEVVWSHLLLLGFPTPDLAQNWTLDPATATERALLKRFFVNEALLRLQ